jgi:hypothetical protein
VIQQSLLNLRSQIQKVANIFVQELFLYGHADNKFTPKFLMAILPTVFLCSISPKNFIRQEALLIIHSLEAFTFNQVILTILNQLCENKNYKIAESSS